MLKLLVFDLQSIYITVINKHVASSSRVGTYKTIYLVELKSSPTNPVGLKGDKTTAVSKKRQNKSIRSTKGINGFPAAALRQGLTLSFQKDDQTGRCAKHRRP